MTLADVYQSTGETQTASEMLAQELAFAEKINQIMQATGTPSQKRAAASGTLQVRDRASQMALIGQEAPEISVKEWINSGPATLSELRGRVVLLEFWATWCKPCQEMFPKLKKLHEKEAALGLEIIALTRHYLAYGGTAESMSDELQLMRRMITEHAVTFAVGVAEDERLQGIYGANGLPTIALIDRRSIVRYAGPGSDDPLFNDALKRCLEESA
jgi:thiol-disulfide isomerase/thioredoxin